MDCFMKMLRTWLTLSVLLAPLVHADDVFQLSGEEITVPVPEGYVRVTEEMSGVTRVVKQMGDTMNDTLACYIPAEDEAAALAGEVPKMERYFVLKVNKQLRNRMVSQKDFNQFKSITKSQNDRIFEDVKRKMPGQMQQVSEGLSEEFDMDLAINLSQMVPLPPHHETDTSMSFSMYINFSGSVASTQMTGAIAATSTFVNASGRVLFLYCYAAKPDLEWSRSASKAWTAQVVASNKPVPSGSSESWLRNLRGYLGLIALVVGGILVVSKLRSA